MRLRIVVGLAAAAMAACGGSDDIGGGASPMVAPPIAPAVAGSGAIASTPVPQAPAPVQPASPAAMQPVSNQPPVTPPAAVPPAAMQPAPGKLAMDECGLTTKYGGDEYCIKAPPADKGFQMRIGPASHDNPEPRYLVQPGEELTENFPVTSGNTTDIYYYWRQYRMRPGSHHLIIMEGAARRLGGSSNAAKDNPEAGVIAPENEGVGMPLRARAQLVNSLHYFNFTDKPIVKEVWVNFWYRDEADVVEPSQEVFSMLGMGIPPGAHVNRHGACQISQPGRLLTVYGHVHSHNQRFSVWRTRGSQKMLVHEAYDWEHPHISEFSSTVMNPTLDPAAKKDGGISGVLDLRAGDVLEFECNILNDTDRLFVGLNEANDDEMCILSGDSVGTRIPLRCTPSDVPVAN